MQKAVKKAKRHRCWACGSLETIKWGKRQGVINAQIVGFYLLAAMYL